MKLFLAAFSTLIFSACVTPYQPKGFRGGYTDTVVDDNAYIVKVEGNGFTGYETIRDYAHRRAQENCNERGYESYKEISDRSGVDQSQRIGASTNCTATTRSYNSYSSTSDVACTHNEGTPITRHIYALGYSCEGKKRVFGH